VVVRFSEAAFEEILDSLWTAEDDPPCPEGIQLLHAFAEARFTDFGFLKPQDMIDLRNCAFIGIPEWDVFADHFSICPGCSEHDEVS
jgi:hypothetical protein